MDRRNAAIEKLANRRLDILTAELEREKALYNKRQNNQRRILEGRRSQLMKVRRHLDLLDSYQSFDTAN